MCILVVYILLYSINYHCEVNQILLSPRHLPQLGVRITNKKNGTAQNKKKCNGHSKVIKQVKYVHLESSVKTNSTR